MTHPLTDDELKKLFWDHAVDTGIGYDWTSDGMRAAADWQLEQVIKFMEEHEQMFGGSGMIFILKDAMRPQVVDLPQANSDVCGEEGMERAQQRTFEENDELMRKLSDS